MAGAGPVLRAQGVEKVYRRGAHEVRAVDGVSLDVAAGEFAVVVGPSGSGKTTLLQILGGIDSPTAGTVVVDGTDLARMTDSRLAAFRRQRLGFVFQFFNLLPTLRAWENVALPHLFDGRRLESARDRSMDLLERVGLAARADHLPAELSGGEMQRVAIARALSADPVLVLADEPTGNLDSRTGADVLRLFDELVAADGRAVVMVTHDERAAAHGTRVIEMVDGRVASASGASGSE